MRTFDVGRCEHCGQTFGYLLNHCGMGEDSYAYCDKCGMTALLSHWCKSVPKALLGHLPQGEIFVGVEQYLQPCECGGKFKKGASPRCPHCHRSLSPEGATAYIEANAPGTKKGWRWQRNWSGMYCIGIEKHVVRDNWKDAVPE